MAGKQHLGPEQEEEKALWEKIQVHAGIKSEAYINHGIKANAKLEESEERLNALLRDVDSDDPYNLVKRDLQIRTFIEEALSQTKQGLQLAMEEAGCKTKEGILLSKHKNRVKFKREDGLENDKASNARRAEIDSKSYKSQIKICKASITAMHKAKQYGSIEEVLKAIRESVRN